MAMPAIHARLSQKSVMHPPSAIDALLHYRSSVQLADGLGPELEEEALKAWDILSMVG